MLNSFLTAAKAWAALAGAVITAVIATQTDPPGWLPVVLAVLTAIATYAVPNAAPADSGDGAGDVEDDALGEH